MAKDINTKYRKLTDVEHVLIRPGRYIGSIAPHTAVTWKLSAKTTDTSKLKNISPESYGMSQCELTWCPGFLKLFDEIISNSVDHSKRPEGAHLDTIRVEIDRVDGTISVHDNGGIPIVMHPEYQEYLPTMLFGYLRSGSNFDDKEDSDMTGQNGEGASLTNIYSTKFTVESCDGKKRFKQTWTDNMMKAGNVKIQDDDGKGFTKVTYTPDYAHLGMTLDDDNYAKLEKRVVDIAGCNPKIKVYLNGERIYIKSFKEYISMYVDQFEYDDGGDWQVGIAASDDGFQQISFVNATDTAQGGSHIGYVTDQIAYALKDYIFKKHKIEMRPSEIKAHMRVYINARINRPRYDSQTKENLITEHKDFKTSWTASDKFIQRVIKAGIIDRVLLWAEAKQKAEELRALKEVNKDVEKADPRRVEKFSDAMEDKDRHLCELYLTEGDSARKSIHEARGKNPYIGSFALKGKPLNVMDCDLKRILIGDPKKNKKPEDGGNQEIKSIMKITGLKIGEKVTNVNQLRFGKIVILSDQDLDGFHVSGLLINIFAYFWPELFELGVIYRMKTPLVIAKMKGGVRKDFFTDADYEEWAKTAPKHEASRYKGLGTYKTPDFKVLMENRSSYLSKVTKLEANDLAAIQLAFKGSMADERKEWLTEANYFADDFAEA